MSSQEVPEAIAHDPDPQEHQEAGASSTALASQPPPPPQQAGNDANTNSQLLEADDDNGDEDEGYIDSSSASAASTSLTSSIHHYEYANGRRYNGYRSGAYLLPNDEEEQDRLDLLHHMFRLMLDGRLLIAPIGTNPQRVLDIGTGTGIWAMEFADEYPSAEVTGNDISPIQPTWVPPNAKFYIDDVENEWVYRPNEAFDFIHCRGMGGSIQDWDKLCSQVYEHLKPGGWLEFQEPEAWMTSDDDSKNRVEFVNQWQTLCNEAALKFGKAIDIAPTLKQRMIDAGFVDVEEVAIKAPVGPWAKDPKLKEIGRFQLLHVSTGVETYTYGFIGKILGWSETECQVLTANTLQELRSRANHLYVKFFFVRGRKPEP